MLWAVSRKERLQRFSRPALATVAVWTFKFLIFARQKMGRGRIEALKPGVRIPCND
jgi:hypothetical protein